MTKRTTTRNPGPRNTEKDKILIANVENLGKTEARTPIAPYDPPPGVIPKNLRAQTLAMDDMDYSWLNAGMGVGYSLAAFPGYPYLAGLAQLPEYRMMTETLAMQMTRKFIKVVAKGTVAKDDRVAQMQEALSTYKVAEVFRRCAELDGFFGRGQIYVDIGMPNAPNVPAWNDPNELATPLFKNAAKIPKGSLRGFTAVEPVWTYPSTYNSTNPLAPNFYKPTQWYVMGKTVHASRLLLMVSRPVPDMLKAAYNFGGISMSQLAEPYVNNWIRTRDSVSDLVHSFSLTGIMTNLESALSGGGVDDGGLDSGMGMVDRATLYNKMRDNRGLFMLDKETEEFFQFNTPLSTIDSLQAQAQEQLASVSHTPLVYLLGTTPAGLNASSDGEIKVYGEYVSSMQGTNFTDNLNTVFDIIQLSEFGEVDPDLGYEFVPLGEMDLTEQATIRKTDADTDAVLIGAGVIAPDEARVRLAGDVSTGYAGLDVNREIEDPAADLSDPETDPDAKADPDD